LHWVQPSSRTFGNDRSPERGCAARAEFGVFQRLDRLQRSAGGILGACAMSIGRRTGPAV